MTYDRHPYAATVLRDARELKVRELERLESLASELRQEINDIDQMLALQET